MSSLVPAKLAELPRYPLAQIPTPLEEAPRLAAACWEQAEPPPRVLIKRDDQTGLALGGNKTRKLEYLVADALDQRADSLITMGAVQSNHCRQTAAAAAKAGLDCHLVLNEKTPGEQAALLAEDGSGLAGNALLDHLCGAKLHFVSRSERQSKAEKLFEELSQQGKRPYLIGVGGSSGRGALGYVAAMQELADQLQAMDQKVDVLVVATSSGGTQAGMVLGQQLFGFKGRILGVAVGVDEAESQAFRSEMASIANEASLLLLSNVSVTPDDFDVCFRYAPPGYGVVGPAERDAIRLLAKTEGLLVGPVYSVKTVMAVADLLRTGKITSGQTVLLWHTGDSPALFAHQKVLST